MTHILWYEIPGFLQSLDGSGRQSSSDLKDGDKVMQLECVLGHMHHLVDHSTTLSRLLRGEDQFGNPLCHLVEPCDDVTNVRGQFQTVLLGPFLLQKLTAKN